MRRKTATLAHESSAPRRESKGGRGNRSWCWPGYARPSTASPAHAAARDGFLRIQTDPVCVQATQDHETKSGHARETRNGLARAATFGLALRCVFFRERRPFFLAQAAFFFGGRPRFCWQKRNFVVRKTCGPLGQRVAGVTAISEEVPAEIRERPGDEAGGGGSVREGLLLV